MLHEQDRAAIYRYTTVVSKAAQGNLAPGGDGNIEKLPKGADEGEDWNLDGAIGGGSAQRVVAKRKLPDSLDEYWRKKLKVLSNVDGSVK